MAMKVRGTQTSKENVREPVEFCRDNILKKLPTIAIQKDTLTYFRNKLNQYETEQGTFKQRLEKYKRISEDRHQLESELLKRRDKVGALQKALSQLQNNILLEREENLKLQNEIECMKMKDKQSAQKIHQLLQIIKGKKLDDDIVYTFDEPLGLHVRQRLASTKRTDEQQTAVKSVYENETSQPVNQQMQRDILENLKEQNESFQTMIQKQSDLTERRIEAVVADCSITLREAELLSKLDREKIQQLAEKLKVAETDLMSVNSELLDLREMFRREEVLREVQKNILLKRIVDTVNGVSSADTVENVIIKVSRIIESASKLFESVEKHDMPENFFDIDQPDSSNQVKNTINLDIYPSKVYSETHSRSLENLSNNASNKHLESTNSHLKHKDSTGQFIHYRDGSGDYHSSPHKPQRSHRMTRCVSFSSVSPENDKENLPERTESAPHLSSLQPRSCLKGSGIQPAKKNIDKSSEGVSAKKSQLGLVRPKTADPRRRQPPENVVLRQRSVNEKKSSDTSKGDGVSLSHHSISSRNRTVGSSKSAQLKNSSGDHVDESPGFFVPFPRKQLHKQLVKQISTPSKTSKPKASRVLSSTEKTIQCDLSRKDLFTSSHDGDDEIERIRNAIPKPRGLFAPRVQKTGHASTKLPQKTTQIYSNERTRSPVFDDNTSETQVKTSDLYQSKYFDSLNFHKSCDERIGALKESIKTMSLELQEIHNRFFHDQTILQDYEDRCTLLERELSFQKNEHEVLTDQQQKQKAALTEQLKMTKSRLSKLERYRRLEVEGFQTDIRMLTQKVREMEKQLYKTLLLYEAGGKDKEFLQCVHTTTKKSMHVSNEVLRLKAKLYQLESSLKDL